MVAVLLPQHQAKVVKEKVKTRVDPRNTLCADTTRKVNATRGVIAITLMPTLPPLPKAKAKRARVRAKEKMGKVNHKVNARKHHVPTSSNMGLANGVTNALDRMLQKISQLRQLWWMKTKRRRQKPKLKPKAKLRLLSLADHRTAGPHRYRQ